MFYLKVNINRLAIGMLVHVSRLDLISKANSSNLWNPNLPSQQNQLMKLCWLLKLKAIMLLHKGTRGDANSRRGKNLSLTGGRLMK